MSVGDTVPSQAVCCAAATSPETSPPRRRSITAAEAGRVDTGFAAVKIEVPCTIVRVWPASYFTRQRLEITTMGHGIIAWIIIGVVAGWITGKLMRGEGFGFFFDMMIGILGAMVGGFLSYHLGLGGVRGSSGSSPATAQHDPEDAVCRLSSLHGSPADLLSGIRADSMWRLFRQWYGKQRQPWR
jgi:uncharacterized membrane protein YeaQ/YmgE (transglycosylase-associated protein family)